MHIHIGHLLAFLIMISKKLEEKIRKISIELISCIECKQKHITFICKRNKIFSVGLNSKKTDPITKKYKYRFQTTHSEISSIKNFQWPISKIEQEGLVIVNVRVMANNTMGLSKPCKNCRILIRDVGFSRCYYTNDDGNFEELKL